MFEDKVSVEEDRLYFRQERIMAIEVRPPCLDHTDLRIGEMMNHLEQPVFRRCEVSIEDGDKLAFRILQPILQSTRLETRAIVTMDKRDWVAHRRITIHYSTSDFGRLIGRVVQYLDFQLFARIVHLADRVDEAIDHKLFIENR